MKNKNKKYTISDIAQMLEISESSVSRAINETPGIGNDLRKRILDFIDEVGYHPNTLAQGLSKGKLKIIALILGDIRNPFYADLTFSIQQLLSKSGYMVMLFNSEYDLAREMEFIRIAEQFNFSGLILITATETEIEERLQSLSMPTVLVNRMLPRFNGDSVLMDNFKAGYIATMHLLELGHNEIGFIMGHYVSSASNQRYEGYKQALLNFSLSFEEEHIYQSDLKIETGYRLAEEFCAKTSKPSAMVIVNDLTAIGFMDGCKKHGLQIPEDLSIVSFDNINISSVSGIDLTTIDQHADKMSEHAVQLMLKQLKTSDAKTERIILDPSLIIRKTTGPYTE